jgi:hypothetical protein
MDVPLKLSKVQSHLPTTKMTFVGLPASWMTTPASTCPREEFADLDKSMFAGLETKIGKDALAGLWQAMNKCVEHQTSSVAMFLPGAPTLLRAGRLFPECILLVSRGW